MPLLQVWAPDAGSVAVDFAGGRHAMARSARGWWQRDLPALGHGGDYAFVIDGGGPLPDPRSAWQPQGVHGPSRWLAQDRFAWSDAGWRAPPLAAAVIEELHIGTFTRQGSFDAAIGRLDHLCGLGVTHVELMPVAAFPGERGWGYDGVALYAPFEGYGGPEALKRFVDACHGKGLAVMLDVVYNHLGPSGNYLRRFGPYFTEAYATPWGEAVNLDGAHSDAVRRYLIDNALMWLRDYHFDGLRLDAVHAIVDASPLHFLEQLAQEVRVLESALARPLVLIAESDRNDPRLVRPVEAGGYGLDAVWNEDFHHALHAALTGERDGYYADFGRLSDVAAALERGLVYDGCYSAYRRRRHGRDAADVPRRRFVGFLQNHDQIGNRALGERAGHLLSPGRLMIGAALTLTAPFVPMLFQGEEWGAGTPFRYFTDHAEPALQRAVRDGRRREFAAFGWGAAQLPDPQARASFEGSRLDWSEPEQAPHRELLAWYRALIALRRSRPALRDDRPGRLRVHVNEAARWISVLRGDICVVCNLAAVAQNVAPPLCAGGSLLLVSDPALRCHACGLRMPPESVAVLDVAGGEGGCPDAA